MVNKLIKLLIKIREMRSRWKFTKSNSFGKTNRFGAHSVLISTQWGMYSGCNVSCEIVNTTIGNYCSFGPKVVIGPRNHITANFTTHDFPYTKNEHSFSFGDGGFNGYFNKIGHDVWIGRNAIILQGVEVGNGAVIAAGSIVTKSVPPYAIVGGNPAKLIRFRFTKEQRKLLEDTLWFHLELSDVIKIKTELMDIVAFEIESCKAKNFTAKKSLSN